MSPYRAQVSILRGRFSYVFFQPWELGIALAAVWSGGGFFVLPHILSQSGVGRVLGSPWDQVWAVTYLVAGLLMLVGIAAPKPRVELPGVLLLAGGSLTQGVALAAVFGVRGVLSVPQFWFFALAGILRVFVLVEASRAVRRT